MKYSNHYFKWHNHKDSSYVKFMKRKFERTFGEHLPTKKDASILEIGCANGLALRTLKDLGYTNLIGVEIDKELAKIAQSQNIQIEIMDAYKFVKETSTKYDFIYLFDVLEHFGIKDIPDFLSSLYDILETDGKLMLVVPNATSPVGAYFRYIDWTHTTSFTPTSLSFLLEESGFKHIEIMSESLIEKPEEEDYSSPQSFEFAKTLSENARFYEAFARWELQSMFGVDQFSNIVSPNMKVVASKAGYEKSIIKINIDDNEIFNLFQFHKRVDSALIELVNFKKELDFLISQVRINKDNIKELFYEHDKLCVEVSEFINNKIEAERVKDFEFLLLSNQINNHIKNMTETIEKNFSETTSLFSLLIRLSTKQNNTIFSKIFRRIKSYRFKKLIAKSNYFDVDFYLKENPDVKGAKVDPILHYLMFGAYEGRNPSESFNTYEYLRANPDLIVEDINPLVHKINANK